MSDELDEATESDDYDQLGLTEEELKSVKNEDEEDEETEDEETEGDEEPEESEEEETVSEEAEVEAEPQAKQDESDSTFAPRFSADSVEGLDEALSNATKDYDTRSEELADKYENGDLSFSEYRKAERELNRDFDKVRNDISTRLLKAEIAQEHSHQAAAQKWELEQNIFFQDNPGYKDDPILRGALSAQLEALYGDEANAGRSGLWFLREAGKVIDARFNREAPETQVKDLDKAKDAMKKKAGKPVSAPKTLADIPAAEANQDSGEFAYLDKLNGMAFERALSKLSPDQYERYMAA